MKDIKSLYEAAKISGKQEDIFAYTDAVKEILESKPIDFLSNLEYIITSDIGLSRLNEFVERYGLSIAVYDDIVSCLESCVKKCKVQGKSSSLYEEYLEKYEAFKSQYSNCFTMFESESDNLNKTKYVNTYYGFNENGVQNSKLLVGMIKEFGEAAVADALVTADRIGGKALDQTFKYLESYESENMSKPTLNQWIAECSIDVADNIQDETSLKTIIEGSLTTMVDGIVEQQQSVYREAVIMGNAEAEVEYTVEDVEVIRDLISFKEYQVTTAATSKVAYEYQKEVYDLYEKFGDVLEYDEGLKEIIPDVKQNGFLPWTKKARAKKKLDKEFVTLVSAKIKNIQNEVESRLKVGIRNAIDDYNAKRGILSNDRVARPAIYTTLGDKYGPSNDIFNGIKRYTGILIEDDNPYLDDIRVWIKYMKVCINCELRPDQIKRYSDVWFTVTKETLTDISEDGTIGVGEVGTEPPKMTCKRTITKYDSGDVVTNQYEMHIPILVSRAYVLKGIDTSKYAVEEVADSVAPMLPQSTGVGPARDFEEDMSLMNTTNKKTGQAPGYISQNHDLSWGEDDTGSEEPKEGQKTLADYEKDSVKGKNDDSSSWNTIDDGEDGDTSSSDQSKLTPEDKKATQNFYYYTYNNSNNEYKNSHNKSDSHNIDNSVDNSRRSDDHSYGKHINSHNDNTDDHHHEESAISDILNLNIPGGSGSFF